MHYVCTGECGGTSDTQINCGTEGCSMKGQPMAECNCEDGKHEEAKKKQETTNDESNV